MKHSNRSTNMASTLNAWRDVVRGSSVQINCGFTSPAIGLEYQPEQHNAKAHSGEKGH